MPIRFARDMPEARSRMIRFLERDAAGMWAQQADGIDVPPHMADVPVELRAARMAAWDAAATRNAELFFVSADLTDLVIEAAKSLPEFGMHPEVLPARSGLLCWAKPVTTRIAERLGIDLPTVAASWVHLPDGVWITWHDDAASLTSGVPEPARSEFMAKFGWLCPGPAQLIPWGERMVLSDSFGPLGAAVLALVATWLLMGQTITESRREQAERAQARRIARRGHPTDPVTYVALRKVERPDGQEVPEQRGREYRSRWMVAGHWRRQWYPSVEQHRPIWIHPYVKGDPDAPLLHVEKVYTLRR